MAKDPICGMDVDEKTGLRLEHDGQTYYFCSPGCRDRFLSEKGLLEPPADETQQSDDREALEPHIEKTTLSIKGMHCASCAAAVEGSLKKVSGVSKAAVNFATEKAYIEYNPAEATPQVLEHTIEKAGYGVLKQDAQTLRLKVIGMDNTHCLGTVEAALKGVKGIVSQQLFLNERATVTFDPTLTTGEAIKKAIKDAGYTPVEETTIDREKEARQREINILKIKLLVSAVFAVPLIYFAMGHHVGLPLPSLSE